MSNNWTQVGQDIDGKVAWERSGYSVSLSDNGNVIAIGANKSNGNNNNSGTTRVYE